MNADFSHTCEGCEHVVTKRSICLLYFIIMSLFTK